MSSRKILWAISLTAFVGVGTALILGSEVWAGDEEQATETLDAETLAQATAFVGEYRFTGGQKERDGVDAAIEASLAEVNAVVRNLGRSRLQESNEIPSNIVITLEGEVLTIHQAGEAHAVRIDGSKVKTKSKHGDKIRVSHSISGSKLTQRIIGDGGERSNRYKLSGDGKRLTLFVAITSDQLPVPVEYSLSYERK